VRTSERDEEALQAIIRRSVAFLGGDLPQLAGFDRLDLADQLLLRDALQAGVERGAHAQPLRLCIGAEPVVQLAPDRGHEPGRSALLLRRVSRSFVFRPAASSLGAISFVRTIWPGPGCGASPPARGSGAGRKLEGALGRAARSAACASDSSLAERPKYPRAAASTP